MGVTVVGTVLAAVLVTLGAIILWRTLVHYPKYWVSASAGAAIALGDGTLAAASARYACLRLLLPWVCGVTLLAWISGIMYAFPKRGPSHPHTYAATAALGFTLGGAVVVVAFVAWLIRGTRRATAPEGYQ